MHFYALYYLGGPGQYPHMATTYAAVMALVSIGTDEALSSIDRYRFYSSPLLPLSLKKPKFAILGVI